MRYVLLTAMSVLLGGCAAGLMIFAPPELPGPAVTLLSGYDLSSDERCMLAFSTMRSSGATDLERTKAGGQLRDLHCGSKPE